MATKYGLTGNWNDDTSWSTSSGGANDTTKPTAADDVILDGGSGNIVLDVTPVCRSLDCTSGTGNYTGVLTHNGSVVLTIGDATAGAGNVALKLSSGMTYTLGSVNTSSISFISTSVTQQTIDFAGKACGPITWNSAGSGSWILSSALNSTSTNTNCMLTRGLLNTNNQTVSCFGFRSDGSNARTLTLGTSTINLTGTSASALWVFSTVTNLTFSGASSLIVFSATSTNTRTFQGGGLTYGTLRYTVAGSTGQLNITGGNTFSEIQFSDTSNARTLAFTAATTTTFTGNGIVGSGAAGRLLVLDSITAASHTLSKTSGTVTLDFWTIKNSTAQGGATWNASTNSTDGGGNSRWIFLGASTSSSVTGHRRQAQIQVLQAKAGSSPGLRRLSDLRRVVYGGRGGAYDELQYLRNQNGDSVNVNAKDSDAWTKFATGRSIPGTRADQLQHDFEKSGSYP